MKRITVLLASVAVSAMLMISACESDQGSQNIPQAPSQSMPSDSGSQQRR
jgi:hypothetical protein